MLKIEFLESVWRTENENLNREDRTNMQQVNFLRLIFHADSEYVLEMAPSPTFFS